jgi:hypothetical protein
MEARDLFRGMASRLVIGRVATDIRLNGIDEERAVKFSEAKTLNYFRLVFCGVMLQARFYKLPERPFSIDAARYRHSVVLPLG